MAFGKGTQKQEQGQTTFESTYLKLPAGERIIRILDTEETEFWRYWLGGSAYPGTGKGKGIIVGRDGPIRQHMDALGKEHPDFRQVQKRFLLNVLDRTPVKKTSKGQAVYADEKGIYPQTADGENLNTTVVAPNNKVMVLEFGSTLLDLFLMLHENIKDRNTFETLPIWRFDVKIITRGAGVDTKRMVLPDVDQSQLPDELFALNKYDLSLLTRPFPNEFQKRLLAGEEYQVLMKELGWERPAATLPQF